MLCCTNEVRNLGRYQLYDELASGGMGTIHLGRISGAAGFARVVAVKRLHEHRARDPKFVSMLVDEARLAARIRHSNVAATLDVVSLSGELFVVMEYVHGTSLSHLMAQAELEGDWIPQEVASAVVIDLLRGLHAAHSAKTETGVSMGLVHRDVSPQNVLVGTDGISRVVDFGVAKAVQRIQSTGQGELKGKIGYMAPEQAREEEVDSRADLFAAAIILWELLSGRRLFTAKGAAARLAQLMAFESSSLEPAARDLGLSDAAIALVLKGLDTDPEKRFSSGEEFAHQLAKVLPPASADVVGAFVRKTARTLLADREEVVARIEAAPAAPAQSSGLKMSEEPTHLLTDPHEAWPPVRGSRHFLLAGALVTLVALVAFLWPDERDPDVPATTESVQVKAPLPPVVPARAREPETHPAEAPAKHAEAPSPEPEAPPLSTPAPSPRPVARPAPVRAPRPAPDPCVPPYVFIDGKKKFKTECL